MDRHRALNSAKLMAHCSYLTIWLHHLTLATTDNLKLNWFLLDVT